MDDKTPDMYKIGKTPEELQSAVKMLRADYDAHNHDGANSKSFQTLVAETLSVRAMLVRKTSYTDTTAGMWAGMVGNTMKMYVGDATAYLKWTGSALQIAGDITAGSLNINNNAIIDSSGNATFIGLTTLNIKVSTDFENVAGARFTKAVGGTGAATTSVYGLDITTLGTGTSFAEVTWFQNFNIFANSPTFTAVVRIVNTDSMGGTGRCFVGLGAIGTTGSGNTFAGKTFCGFQFEKTGGVINFYARQNDGNGDGGAISGVLSATITDLDAIDLIIKINGSTSISYYYRINSNAISAVTTLSTRVPTSGEGTAYFSITNVTTAFTFDVAVVGASYER